MEAAQPPWAKSCPATLGCPCSCSEEQEPSTWWFAHASAGRPLFQGHSGLAASTSALKTSCVPVPARVAARCHRHLRSRPPRETRTELFAAKPHGAGGLVSVLADTRDVCECVLVALHAYIFQHRCLGDAMPRHYLLGYRGSAALCNSPTILPAASWFEPSLLYDLCMIYPGGSYCPDNTDLLPRRLQPVRCGDSAVGASICWSVHRASFVVLATGVPVSPG